MTAPEAQVHSSAIRRADLFRGLAPDVVNELLPVWQVHRARTGTVLFRPEDAATRLWIVLSGRVGMTDPARTRLLAVLDAGDALGEVAIFAPDSWAFTAVAMTPSSLVSASGAEVLAWVGRHPAVSARLLQHMARRLALKSRGVRGTTAADVPARVARGLLTLADKYTVDAVVRHGLTQQQLAEVMGASREKVNKALKDFADRRWVELARGCFVLLDEPALRRRAGMPQRPLAVR